MLLTPEGLGFFATSAVVIGFLGLLFSLFVVLRSRHDRGRTLEAIGLLAVGSLTVYGSLLLGSYLPQEPAPWKFTILVACMSYIIFNMLTFPSPGQKQ